MRNVLRRVKTFKSTVIALFFVAKILLSLALLGLRLTLLRVKVRLWLLRNRRKLMKTMKSSGVPHGLAKELVKVYSLSAENLLKNLHVARPLRKRKNVFDAH